MASAAGSPMHLSEGAQTGYTAGAVSCVRDGSTTQTGTAGAVDFTVQPGQPSRSTLFPYTTLFRSQVVKRVDGAQTAGWTVNASSPSAPMTVSPGSVTTVAS